MDRVDVFDSVTNGNAYASEPTPGEEAQDPSQSVDPLSVMSFPSFFTLVHAQILLGVSSSCQSHLLACALVEVYPCQFPCPFHINCNHMIWIALLVLD